MGLHAQEIRQRRAGWFVEGVHGRGPQQQRFATDRRQRDHGYVDAEDGLPSGQRGARLCDRLGPRHPAALPQLQHVGIDIDIDIGCRPLPVVAAADLHNRLPHHALRLDGR